MSKADLGKEVAQAEVRFERSLRVQFYWTVTIMVALQVPTWSGLIAILILLTHKGSS